MNPAHLYIHFPYCLYKCHYCDFNSYETAADAVPKADYVKLLGQELARREALFAKTGFGSFAQTTPVTTIFIGGGTPSLMDQESLAELFNVVRSHLNIIPNAEITLESNPGTLTLDKLKSFKAAGVNRLSVGIQSFADQNLQRFGRIHSGEQAKLALSLAQDAGFSELSGDLIFGFPDQTLEDWRRDLDTILDFDLPHISCYALTPEAKTKYASDLAKGRWPEPDSELVTEMMTLTEKLLTKAGYRRYEISNYAKSGHESQHNLGYWRYRSYLGIGAGATSQFILPATPNSPAQVIRQNVVKLPEDYAKTLVDDHAAFFSQETIDARTAMAEFAMMGFRLADGINADDFEKIFAQKFENIFAREIQKHESENWIEQTKRGWRATDKGKVWLNSWLVDYLL